MNYGKRVLTVEFIKSKVSDLDLCKYYCKNFKKVNESFCSELRNDAIASCSVQSWNNNLFYKDFSTGDSYNMFGYIKTKYGISYKEVLEMIAKDFQLIPNGNIEDLPSMFYFGISERKSVEQKLPTTIKVKIRNWTSVDKDYWKVKYDIGSVELINFKIFPISYFWINDRCHKCNVNSYGYFFGIIDNREIWKIYQPLEDRAIKWFSNTTKAIMQGENQLDQFGDILFITSSLKDTIVLKKLGYSAIAPASESTSIEESIINGYKVRFKRLVIFYDNDEPGIRASNKHKKLYDCDDIMIPLSFKVKDPSDFVEQYGYALLEEIIKTELK